ncbi:hypothetical protein FQR65_LT10774 [Abscondita terminalis]|nr:hypothetical protein FQR65_LT10774 [Abscondita terminalis]
MGGLHRCYKLAWRYRIKLALIVILAFGMINIVQIAYIQVRLDSSMYVDNSIDVVYTWVNGSDPHFKHNLFKYLKLNVTQDYSHQRFDDKYELKFSLRSLEKYAPWVRHVYIVTNGQIPYWLNLDCEKVSLVSHEEIFLDTFDLPTFSSPAIESHLHRIPGLTNRFIYFNDDILLGKRMFVDDFINPSSGFFIYLAWPLPMCAADCPWMYVGDGQCDTSCYNPQCQLDGGDCDNYSNERLWNGTKDDEKATIINQRIEEIPKINHTSESTLKTRFAFMRNATNLTSLVERHNKQVILLNKITRKKRYYKNSMGEVGGSSFDAYGASLQHTNRIYNLRYGFKPRYAPAHAPIMIDKEIMVRLQDKFGKEFRKTSRNRFRSIDDMQFSFSYYYFVMNEKRNVSGSEIFDRFDTDASGTWSDREIRTLLTKLYDLPLTYATVDHFEELLLNCSKHWGTPEVSTPEYERYVDSKLTMVTKELVLNCPNLLGVLSERFGSRSRYKYDVIHNAQNSHIAFKMLSSNISEVVGHLDEIRRSPRKFICLNDNMDESKVNENELIRAVLYDFYLAMFPHPSQFELPSDFRNRFLNIKELNEWKHYHYKLKVCTYFCVFVLCYLTYCNLFKRRNLYRFCNKLFY